MKHAISFYIDDESEIVGFYGSVVVKTNGNKSISSFNLNEKRLMTKNTWHIASNGEGTSIGKDRECVLEVVREEINNDGPFTYEEWCRCTNCGYKHALFIPREYCPRCGYKFTKTIYKGDGVLYGKEKK